MRRKHRKVRNTWSTCACPAGTKRVSTCSSKAGAKVCRGRGWGCLGVGTSKNGKRMPKFFAAECSEPELAPVKQWRGKKRSKQEPERRLTLADKMFAPL